MLDTSTSVGEAQTAVRGTFQAVARVLANAHSAKRRAAYNKAVLKVPYVEPRLYRSVTLAEAKKGAVQFSLIELLGRLLQTSKAARDAIITKSEEWKTGTVI